MSKKSSLSFSLDIEYLFPLLDLWMSVIVIAVSECHNIDLEAYAEQSAIYLKHTNDYSKLIGDTGPIQYPAASLYLYSFFNWLWDFQITKDRMMRVHVILDMIRMWLIVKVYKRAFSGRKQAKMFTFMLLFVSAKYKYVGVTRHFNDCFMVVFCLAAILVWQHQHLILSAVLFAIAINIKMSALLMIPGYLLTVAFNAGLLRALMTLAFIAALQIVIGLEFILVNKEAYFSMSYNMDRVFMKVEQVNFQWMTEDFMQSQLFCDLLLGLHLLFLAIFLVFKWTPGAHSPYEMLEEVGLLPLSRLGTDLLTRRPLNQYKVLLILFTSNFIGMAFSRGTHQQFYSWYNYTLPFLADAALGDE